MSSASDSSNLADNQKRSASPGRESDSGCPPPKRSRAGEDCPEPRAPSSPTRSPTGQDRAGSGQGDCGAEAAEPTGTPEPETTPRNGGAGAPDGTPAGAPAPTEAPAPSTDPAGAAASHGSERSDSAAFAAAEALASLTGGPKELPCSSRQALSSGDAPGRPACSSRGDRERQRDRGRECGRQAEAAAADSSSSVLGPGPERDAERNDEDEDEDEDDEDDEDSLAGSSSTASSSASENEEPEDGECAIVAVRMAPEVRQTVSLLAQVQMRLDALEKRGARLHQRLELKLSRQRRPHLDQRGAITQTIPGFWVTALLNHPHLSAHIDENDEDALSYMTNLEIETFKNNKLGYRICFHFRRNPFFQNKVIVKELHLGMGGSPVSFSNPILWHRGQTLTGNGEPRRTSRGVYQSFFHWFSDHTSPGRDEIAQILKDDLYRNPLRYYLTPLWEPRQNGSTPKPPDNSNGDECVIISDSDDEQEVGSQDQRREREDEDDDRDVAAPDDSDQEAGSSFEDREEEELDVEEVEGCEVRTQDQEEEDDAEEDEGEEETKRKASDSTYSPVYADKAQ